MVSISAIVMERYVDRQTDRREKDHFTTKSSVTAAIFEDSVSRVIPVAVVKINKMAESESPRMALFLMGVNEVEFFAYFLQQ